MSLINPMTLASNVGKGAINFAKRNDTKLMTLAVCGGVVATGVLSGKASIEAYKVLEEAEYTSPEPLTPKQKAQKTWKIFIPPFAAAVATITIAGFTEHINLSKQAALFEAYTLAKNARTEFVEKSKEIFGEKKVEEVKDAIVSDKVKADPPNELNVIYTTHGDTLCKEGWHGRYFKSDIPFLKEGINKLDGHINAHPMNEASIADIFREWGLPYPERDENWRFNQDTGPIIEHIHYRSGLDDVTGLPFFYIDFDDAEPMFSH